MFIETLPDEIIFEMRLRLHPADWKYWTYDSYGYIEISPDSDLPLCDTLNADNRRFVSTHTVGKGITAGKNSFEIISYDRVYINSFTSIDEIKQFVYPKFKVLSNYYFKV